MLSKARCFVTSLAVQISRQMRDWGLTSKILLPKILADGVSGSFLINSATLCRFLSKAEQKSKKAKQVRGVVQNVSYLAQRNDARENTPPEEINSEGRSRICRRRTKNSSSGIWRWQLVQSRLSQKKNCSGSSPLIFFIYFYFIKVYVYMRLLHYSPIE